MKQRRTMGIGQTICLSLLLVLLGASMFLPVFRFNKTAIELAENKGIDYAMDHVDWSALGIESLDQAAMEKRLQKEKEDISEYSEEMEEEIKEHEKEYGVKIRQISAFRIMTNNFSRLLTGKSLTLKEKWEAEEDETFSKILKIYNRLRVLLWIIYLLAFVLLFIVILGAALRWSKFVATGIAMVYSLAAVAVFALLRFGLAGFIGAEFGGNKIFLDAMDGGMGGLMDYLMASSFNMTSMTKKMFSSFHSIGFLVSFILAILLVISCLFIMLTGNRRETLVDDWGGMSTDDFNPFGVAGSNAGFGLEVTPDQYTMPAAGVAPSTPDRDLTATPTAPLSPMAPPPVAAAVSVPSPIAAPRPAVSAPVGQVKCTMGSAVGQGFRLPADRKVVIGKSPQNANLVINHPNVSNIHCSVRYNASNNSYIVKDHSMNGTFVNGVRLQKEVAMAYPAGTVLSLADGTNQVTLG